MFGRRWQVPVLVVLALVAWGAMPAGASGGAAPGLTVGSPTIMPGARLQLAGTGFGAVEGVDVFFDRTDARLAVSDRRGAFAGALRAPANAIPGIHWVSAVGRRSGVLARTRVEVLGTASWPQSGHDAARTSWNPDERAIRLRTVAGLRPGWSQPVEVFGGPTTSTADTIFVAGSRDEAGPSFVAALDLRTGSQIWAHDYSGVWIRDMAVDGGVLVVAPEHYWRGETKPTPAHLMGLDVATGELRWSVDLSLLSKNSVGPVAVKDGMAYAVSETYDYDARPDLGVLWAIRISDGTVTWHVTRKTYLQSVAASGSTIVVPTMDDGVLAFEAQTGAQRWHAESGMWTSPEVALGGGRAIVTTTSSNGQNSGIVALDVATGDRVWSVSQDPYLWTSGIAIVRDRILVATSEGESSTGDLVALDAATGHTLWRTTAWASGLVAAGHLAYMAGDGMLDAYDVKNGQHVLAAENIAEVRAVVNGRVLVDMAGDQSPALDVLVRATPAAPTPKLLLPDPTLQPDRAIEPHDAMTEGWARVPTDGLRDDTAATTAASFRGQTYVGTEDPSVGGGLYRISDGTLVRVGAAGLGDPRNTALDPVAVGGRLYVVTTNRDGLQVWSSTDGSTFQRVVDGGFGDRENDSAVPMVIAGRLVLGVANERTGLQLWLAGNDLTAPFTKVLGVPASPVDGVTAPVVFDGATYVGTTGPTHELLRTTDGVRWSEVAVVGLPETTTRITPQVVFDDALYLVSASRDGLRVLRTTDGSTYERVEQGSLPLPQDVAIDGRIVVFDGGLYLFGSSLDPRRIVGGEVLEIAPEHGFRLWRSTDGSTWRPVAADGFGDRHNVGATPMQAGDALYVAVANHEEGDTIYRSADGQTYTPAFREASTSQTSVGITMVLDGRYLVLLPGDGTRGMAAWRSVAPVTEAGVPGYLIALVLALFAVIAVGLRMLIRRRLPRPPKIVLAEPKREVARPLEPV